MTAHPTELVQIEKPVYGGAFLARAEGKAVFVPLTLPGEQVRVRITQDKRGYATAEAEEIVVAAPERIVPGCRHFGVCGGCSYQHTDYETQLALKQAILRETLERGGVHAPDEIALLSAEPWGLSQSHPSRLRCAGKPGIPRTTFSCGGSNQRVPDCRAAAGQRCGGGSGDSPANAPAARRDFAVL